MSQTPRKIEVRRLPNWEAATPLREAWNTLVMRSTERTQAAASLFQTYEWNHAWWKAFGAGKTLVLLAAFDGEELVGIGAMMVHRKWNPLPSKVLCFIGSSNFASDYCALVSAPGRGDTIGAFADWIAAHPRLWDELELFNVLEGSPELRIFKDRFEGRFFRPALTHLNDAPCQIFGSAEESRELVNRKSLKRHFNWFNKQGQLTFGHHDSAPEVLARLDDFFEQHIGRRTAAGTSSQFKCERQREFYRTLTQTLAPQGWLRFFSVELDGKAVAYHFGFELAGKLYWYKPSFDAQYSNKSPGEVLLKTLFEYAIGKGLREFDFTVGREAFKYRFSNHVRKLYQLRAFRSLPHYAVFRAEGIARWIFRRLLKPAPKPQAAQLLNT